MAGYLVSHTGYQQKLPVCNISIVRLCARVPVTFRFSTAARCDRSDIRLEKVTAVGFDTFNGCRYGSPPHESRQVLLGPQGSREAAQATDGRRRIFAGHTSAGHTSARRIAAPGNSPLTAPDGLPGKTIATRLRVSFRKSSFPTRSCPFRDARRLSLQWHVGCRRLLKLLHLL